MLQEFIAYLATLADLPVVQALLAGAASLVLEDPVTLACGLLVAGGSMSPWAAALGLTVGLAVGDLGLYMLGRYPGRMLSKRILERPRFEKSRQWLSRNLITAVLTARCIPGMRFPTYVAAGLARAPVWKFALVAVGASALWTLTILYLTVRLGAAVGEYLGPWRWVAGVGLVVLAAGVQICISRRRRDLGGE
ncbi:DedA family protein [Desulfohalovibrio reitneri]|uniref:DedA family protein n=1 Tax=Desulfohalovibrio reitneri TaxID=1307759 RepID=UPI0004A74189|nr:DedA family protein [Desulfohalovibrio reitneri]